MYICMYVQGRGWKKMKRLRYVIISRKKEETKRTNENCCTQDKEHQREEERVCADQKETY